MFQSRIQRRPSRSLRWREQLQDSTRLDIASLRGTGIVFVARRIHQTEWAQTHLELQLVKLFWQGMAMLAAPCDMSERDTAECRRR
eukprot:3381786-Rhodomonas_salina.1